MPRHPRRFGRTSFNFGEVALQSFQNARRQREQSRQFAEQKVLEREQLAAMEAQAAATLELAGNRLGLNEDQFAEFIRQFNLTDLPESKLRREKGKEELEGLELTAQFDRIRLGALKDLQKSGVGIQGIPFDEALTFPGLSQSGIASRTAIKTTNIRDTAATKDRKLRGELGVLDYILGIEALESRSKDREARLEELKAKATGSGGMTDEEFEAIMLQLIKDGN